jgi:hypothetical protein
MLSKWGQQRPALIVQGKLVVQGKAFIQLSVLGVSQHNNPVRGSD